MCLDVENEHLITQLRKEEINAENYQKQSQDLSNVSVLIRKENRK